MSGVSESAIEQHAAPRTKGRWAIALAAGGVVFLIAAWTGYSAMRAHYGRIQIWALRDLKQIRLSLEPYHSKYGKWPARLDELDRETLGTLQTRDMADGSKQVLDQWENPLEYQNRGRDFSLFSYGRDGVPGGSGPDSDIDGLEPDHFGQALTFRQFLTGGRLQSKDAIWKPYWMLSGAALAGTLASMLFLRMTSLPESDTKMGRFVALIAVAAATFFVGLGLVLVHVPNGH